MLEDILRWDQETFIYFNGLGTTTYDLFWVTVTEIYTWIPLFILFFVLISLKFPKREVFSKVLTIAFLIGFVLLASYVTKEWVARLRPNNTEEINTIIRILKRPTDYSFFSGHSSSSFAITTLIVLFLRKKIKWAWIFFLWPLLFAYSRIYVGVHYPVDLFVGAFVGIAAAFLFYKIHKKIISPYLV
ncbi:undecaprenyl-diphosphatase [Saonia flava]|uniref:Undecaprenyl-diphosphatase n=1 Tax=Saonia flava TaxID=523696 RepID=A0A846QVZ8_9FLAO|nr:phosphatase PAP2 family protein [Saonia flava]NJB70742.1 undecaprenyl-diphosphatase [Saonia flava]